MGFKFRSLGCKWNNDIHIPVILAVEVVVRFGKQRPLANGFGFPHEKRGSSQVCFDNIRLKPVECNFNLIRGKRIIPTKPVIDNGYLYIIDRD